MNYLKKCFFIDYLFAYDYVFLWFNISYFFSVKHNSCNVKRDFESCFRFLVSLYLNKTVCRYDFMLINFVFLIRFLKRSVNLCLYDIVFFDYDRLFLFFKIFGSFFFKNLFWNQFFCDYKYLMVIAKYSFRDIKFLVNLIKLVIQKKSVKFLKKINSLFLRKKINFFRLICEFFMFFKVWKSLLIMSKNKQILYVENFCLKHLFYKIFRNRFVYFFKFWKSFLSLILLGTMIKLHWKLKNVKYFSVKNILLNWVIFRFLKLNKQFFKNFVFLIIMLKFRKFLRKKYACILSYKKRFLRRIKNQLKINKKNIYQNFCYVFGYYRRSIKIQALLNNKVFMWMTSRVAKLRSRARIGVFAVDTVVRAFVVKFNKKVRQKFYKNVRIQFKFLTKISRYVSKFLFSLLYNLRSKRLGIFIRHGTLIEYNRSICHAKPVRRRKIKRR